MVATYKLKQRGKHRRKRAKRQLAHKPNGHGQGRWHSRTSLWKAYRLNRRKRAISNASRRRNRAA